MLHREVYVQLHLSRLGKSELRYAVSLAKRLHATLVVVSPPGTDAERVRRQVAEWAPEAGSFDQFFPLHGSVPRLSDNAILVGAFPHWPNSGGHKSRRVFTDTQDKERQMIIGQRLINEQVLKLHEHPIRAVVSVTGGGVGLLPLLWNPGGMSKTLIDHRCPYERIPLADALGVEEAKCRPETARRMAAEAYAWAEEVSQREPKLRGAPIVGVGLTAALASGHKSQERIHAAALGPKGMRMVNILFEKGRVDRINQGRWADLVALSLLFDAAGLETVTFEQHYAVASAELLPGNHGTMWLQPSDDFAQFNMPESEIWTLPVHRPDGQRLAQGALDPAKHVLYPGSFNPIQFGHVESAEMVEVQTGKEVVFAITANHPTKGRIPDVELLRRRRQFSWRHPVVFTQDDPLYVDKARTFPGFSFLIGADVMMGILDEKYYGGLDGLHKALRELLDLRTTFLVCGRTVDGAYRTVEDIPVPEFCRALFKPVSGRWDIRSSDLR